MALKISDLEKKSVLDCGSSQNILTEAVHHDHYL